MANLTVLLLFLSSVLVLSCCNLCSVDALFCCSAISVVVDDPPVTKLTVNVEIDTEGEVDGVVLYKCLPVYLVGMNFPSQ